MNRLGIFVLVFALLIAGCPQSGSTTTEYVCSDGSVVSDPANCAQEEVSAPSAPAPAEQPSAAEPEPEPEPEEVILSDFCVSMSEEELETYKLTQEDIDCYLDWYIYPAMDGTVDYEKCDEIILSGYDKAGCYGGYAGFQGDNTKCLALEEDVMKDFCIQIFASSSIDNGHPVSTDLCNGITDTEQMEDCIQYVSNYLPCKDADNFCPPGCNYLIDNDCPTYSLGQKAITGGVEITIPGSGIIQHCYTEYDSEYLTDSDYGYYYVINVNVKNGGISTEYVLSSDFVLMDNTGKQYDPDWYILGETCEDADLFEGGEMYPKSTDSGQLWFELGDMKTLPVGEKKLIYDPNYFIDGDEIIYVFN